jgi:hypothetical protein
VGEEDDRLREETELTEREIVLVSGDVGAESESIMTTGSVVSGLIVLL